MDHFYNFHTFFINNNNNDLTIYHYLAIESLFLTNNIDQLFIHYYNLPYGKLWNKIMDNYGLKIKLVNIKIPEKLFYEYRLSIIFNILYEYGGFYFEKNVLFLNNIKINNLIRDNIYKTIDNSLFYSIKENNFTYSLFKYFLDNSSYTIKDISDDHINNITPIYLQYDINVDNLNYIINKEISDYTFGQYFHIINNSEFFTYHNIDNNEIYNLDYNTLFKKITIFNLLIRSIYAIKYIKDIDINNQIETNIYEHKFNLINNIDKIYWINLERSDDRKIRMENLLKNINIENERVNAYDGHYENEINKKYFNCIDGNECYPINCNKEYAILLSHLSCIETFINNNNNNNNEKIYNIGLIYEDDLSFDFIQYWDKDIKTLIDETPDDWEILMLGYFSLNLEYKDEINKWDNEWSALSYLINGDNIKKNNKINLLKDENNKWKCNKDEIMVADHYIFKHFNTYVSKYPYFTFPNDNDSTLHDDHIQYHKIYKICNYLTLERVVENFYLE